MQNLEQEREETKGKDLSPKMIERATAPKKTWFFLRYGDKKIFACEEREAWQICYNKSSWRRRDFQMLGSSDGTTYQRIVKESMTEARKLQPEIEKKQTELKRYMDAEDNLVMNEVVDMEGDPSDTVNEANKQKVLRLRKIIERLHNELDKMEEKYKEVTGDIVAKATEAELKVAKANQAKRVEEGLDVDWPDENLNILTPAGSSKPRKKIIGLMEGRIN